MSEPSMPRSTSPSTPQSTSPSTLQSTPQSAPTATAPSVFTTMVLVSLATVYVVWGSTYFAIRLTLESFPPFLQGGLRFVVAGALLLGYLAARGRPMPTARQWRDGTIVGVLLLTLGNGGVVFAEQFVSSSVAAIFIGAGPLAAALWSGMFGFWPQRLQWAGILIGFAGIVLLAGGSELAGHPIGLASLVIAVLCWTLGSVLAQQRLSLAPGAMGFATEMLTGGAVMLVIGLARGEGGHLAAAWPPTTVAMLALGYLVFAALAAFSAYMYLLSKVSAAIAISYAYVNPVIAVLLGVLIGGEHLSTREAIATTIIVGSVILLTRERPREG